MSPFNWNSSGNADVFFVRYDGYLTYNGVNNTYGLRPVINLKAGTLFAVGGNGTQNNPYVVS